MLRLTCTRPRTRIPRSRRRIFRSAGQWERNRRKRLARNRSAASHIDRCVMLTTRTSSQASHLQIDQLCRSHHRFDIGISRRSALLALRNCHPLARHRQRCHRTARNDAHLRQRRRMSNRSENCSSERDHCGRQGSLQESPGTKEGPGKERSEGIQESARARSIVRVDSDGLSFQSFKYRRSWVSSSFLSLRLF